MWKLTFLLFILLLIFGKCEVVKEAHFSFDTDGFRYVQDYFGTNEPNLTSGGRVKVDGVGALEVGHIGSENNRKETSAAWLWTYRSKKVFNLQISFRYRIEVGDNNVLSNADKGEILVTFDKQEIFRESIDQSTTDIWNDGYIVVRNVTDFQRHRLAFGARIIASSSRKIQFTHIIITRVANNRHAQLTTYATQERILPLRKCEGPCFSHQECAGNLACFLDRKTEEVPGCIGKGIGLTSYCHEENLVLAGDNQQPAKAFPLRECEGDCDRDEDCMDDLRCFHRNRYEAFPGCVGQGEKAKDFCYRESLNNVGNDGKPRSSYPLGECMGDCDTDSDCEGDLVCFQRREIETVPGCMGIGQNKVDYCYRERLETVSSDQKTRNNLLEKCQGSCDEDADFAGFLKCFHRIGLEEVPGCPAAGQHGANYCFDDGTVLNIVPPSNTSAISYKPGDLKVNLFDSRGRRVRVSAGLGGRAIAYSGRPVEFTGQARGVSTLKFHGEPDAAACYPHIETGGHFYVSNSENRNGKGGVGVIALDSSGEVVGYFRTLTGTSRNCGGGKTPWGSWISCEENGQKGRVWQTDPKGVVGPQMTALVPEGGNYESFAYDDRGGRPSFFVTEDTKTGPVVRFQPDEKAMRCYNSSIPEDRWCTLNSGTYSFLSLSRGDCRSGNFSWEPRKNRQGEKYQNSEGIDCRSGVCYFVSKREKCLYQLDLDKMTYKASSTISGAFNRQPDQIKALTDDPESLVYFCEDGGNDCGIHARDISARFFSVVDGPGYRTETTGLAFSPDRRFMYVSFQMPGTIWQFWRTDGRKFTSTSLDIKYHAG